MPPCYLWAFFFCRAKVGINDNVESISLPSILSPSRSVDVPRSGSVPRNANHKDGSNCTCDRERLKRCQIIYIRGCGQMGEEYVY